ncbi:MAG: nuclear transport factor 2 family protein [Tistlia sp.]|uniref:YybH family protein n=1 Tax=Tistlia sp. TaxID=3057121 RepID=UPI0034A41D77
MDKRTASSLEAEIRAHFANWTKAVQAQDLEAIMAPYAEEVVAFDAIVALRFEGREAYRRHWEACMAYCTGPMVFELHDLKILGEGGLAFCHALVRCGGAGPDGEVKTGWMRMTAGLRRHGDGWQVVHEHYSAPFDVETGKALFDLEPEREPQPAVA